jgi:4-deoxy-L-threo-5-hexosulose-uronate ketol-isomerase
MKLHYFPLPKDANTLSTEQLRETFLVVGLFQPGQITAHYTDLDRMIIGGVLPASTPIVMPVFKATGSNFFLERREIGILNLASPGVITVSGQRYEVGTLDCLYIGLGEKDISFENGPSGQAAFYFVSTPAHAKYPTTLMRRADVKTDPIGDVTKANRRRINKYIHIDGIKSCQLVLGFTEFEPGSLWNTMPPHTHSRRTEVYLYFDLADQMVVHLMGEPQATRHLIVRDREAVLSPAWSIHAGVGTASYRFVWAMGGDNQVFSDMDPAPIATLL